MSFVASLCNDIFISIKDVRKLMVNYALLNICYYIIMQYSNNMMLQCSKKTLGMNLYLSLLHNQLNPADNETDECFAIGFTRKQNLPDN